MFHRTICSGKCINLNTHILTEPQANAVHLMQSTAELLAFTRLPSVPLVVAWQTMQHRFESWGKGSWRYASKSENLVKPAGPVPAPNSSEALQSSKADIPPDPVDGIVANVGNIISEDNDLGWKHPRHISNNPVTTAKAERATPDSNSFAALLSPDADTMHTLEVDSSKSEVMAVSFVLMQFLMALGGGYDTVCFYLFAVGVLEPLGPLVVDNSSSIQCLPACDPQLSKDVQLVEEPRGPPSTCISSHSRSSRSARRVLVEAAQALENKDVGPP
ncbi:hypothetical protein Nepgr_007817 [Nepenthes gracilis]|uniref:Uncharacterized protein n=1 Tax=Nepenthes gracilis TaxID=150966 RepID=A0AAD3S7K3_NEPGR|nr:hypothetical protein Nepgr_007817 [Nepenthes gracilis]